MEPGRAVRREGRPILALVLLLLSPAGSSGQSAEVRDVPVNGIVLHTVTLGSGTPIVVIHGGPGLDHGYLLPGMAPLASTNRIILYDQRGVGGSVARLDSTSITMANYLADLDGLRDALGLKELNLVGHSFGGLIAMLYAMRYPDRVASLVLMNTVEPGRRYAAEQSDRQRGRRTPADSAEIAGLIASAGFRARESAVFERLFWLSFRSTFANPALADRLQIHLAEVTAKNGSEVARLLVGPLGAYDYWDELGAIRARVLIIHGVDDAIPISMAEELSRRIPGARLQAVEHAGHFPYIEAADVVFDAIRRFIDGK
jgi:proline iminopeptidase